jgi:hypothetical protein
MKNLLIVFAFLLLCTGSMLAQEDERPAQSDLVQFSGIVLDGSTQQLYPIPYAAVGIKSESRGTYANLEGFFTIVATKGDTVLFSALGYKNVEYVIPVDLEEDQYSLVQLMTQDAINLPTTVVFPWPSREHFKLEFLAMDVTPELQTRAAENLSADKLEELRSTVSTDGAENANFYLRQQSRQTYYIGQRPPMNIFSPVAWKQFFDGWKRGDFKKDRD